LRSCNIHLKLLPISTDDPQGAIWLNLRSFCSQLSGKVLPSPSFAVENLIKPTVENFRSEFSACRREFLYQSLNQQRSKPASITRSPKHVAAEELP
jgi:hypothetical protein